MTRQGGTAVGGAVPLVGRRSRAYQEATHGVQDCRDGPAPDFRVARPATQKIKKQGRKLVLELVENQNFLLELRDDFVKVGFAAETEDLIANARDKLARYRKM